MQKSNYKKQKILQPEVQEEGQEEEKMRMGRWIDELLKSLNKNIYLETSEGVVREGKLTGFDIREIQFLDDLEDIDEFRDPTLTTKFSGTLVGLRGGTTLRVEESPEEVFHPTRHQAEKPDPAR